MAIKLNAQKRKKPTNAFVSVPAFAGMLFGMSFLSWISKAQILEPVTNVFGPYGAQH